MYIKMNEGSNDLKKKERGTKEEKKRLQTTINSTYGADDISSYM